MNNGERFAGVSMSERDTSVARIIEEELKGERKYTPSSVAPAAPS